jgi:hypothetical protein
MKGADFPGVSATVSPARNGAHRPAKRHGTATRRVAARDAVNETRSEPDALPAPFATREAAPVDSPMWPLHLALWFQPELAPAAPDWSGLTIERRSRIPAPGFLHSPAEPSECPEPPALADSSDPLSPLTRPGIPQDGGAPAGWDPRAMLSPIIARKGEHE